MGATTKIEWADATWNPIRGCSVVSKGCKNCYAMKVASRFSGPGQPYEGLAKNGQWTGVVREVPDKLREPLRWNRPRRIFVNSMSDLFHESLAEDSIDRVFAVMMMAQRHVFQVLTKRPDRMLGYLTDEAMPMRVWREARRLGYRGVPLAADSFPLPNVWLGVTAEDQATADKRIPFLAKCPSAVRWVSYEPALGPVDWSFMLDLYDDRPMIEWLVAGGESGPGARPAHPDWFRQARDQCADAGVPFLFKQWGNWKPMENGYICGLRPSGEWSNSHLDIIYMKHHKSAKAAGRTLDGRTHDEYPA